MEFIQNWLTLENGKFRCQAPFYRGNSDASPIGNKFIGYLYGFFIHNVCHPIKIIVHQLANTFLLMEM